LFQPTIYDIAKRTLLSFALLSSVQLRKIEVDS
jgi:hypothetical protein